MESDPLTATVGQALAALIRYVDSRPEDATTDDDVRALEDVARVLQQAPATDHARLRELLGEQIANGLGLH